MWLCFLSTRARVWAEKCLKKSKMGKEQNCHYEILYPARIGRALMSFTVGWDFMRKRDLKSIYKESMPTERINASLPFLKSERGIFFFRNDSFQQKMRKTGAKIKLRKGKRPMFFKDKVKLVKLPVSKIPAQSSQPRKTFREDELKSLALSIEENGLLQPVTVRKEGRHLLPHRR